MRTCGKKVPVEIRNWLSPWAPETPQTLHCTSLSRRGLELAPDAHAGSDRLRLLPEGIDCHIAKQLHKQDRVPRGRQDRPWLRVHGHWFFRVYPVVHWARGSFLPCLNFLSYTMGMIRVPDL